MVWLRTTFIISAFLIACSVPAFARSQVDDLRQEYEQIKKDIEHASTDHARLAGGLVKSLIASRLELLKTNAALVQQRIHALESGAKIKIVLIGSKPDPKRAAQLRKEIISLENRISEQKKESAKYSGGLVKAMIESGVATSQMSLAMLNTEYLKAKYGIRWLPSIKQGVKEETPPTITRSSTAKQNRQRAAVKGSRKGSKVDRSKNILIPTLTNKRFQRSDWRSGTYEDAIWFDVVWDLSKLKKATRAIKGVLILADLFGEEKIRLKWTVNDSLRPNQKFSETGVGFQYNEFLGSHRWVRTTELSNMTFQFQVKNVIYADGSREQF